jgi:hypothetical protein
MHHLDVDWARRLKTSNMVWREAEKLLGDDTTPLQMVDPLT